MRVIVKLREACEAELSIHALFESPTISGLAARIDSDQHSELEFEFASIDHPAYVIEQKLVMRGKLCQRRAHDQRDGVWAGDGSTEVALSVWNSGQNNED